MYVRKKHNPSGVVSIQVIDKSSGKYRVVKTIGSSKEPDKVSEMYSEGKKWVASYTGGQDLFVLHEQQREEKQVTEYLLSNIENILLNGTRLILDQVYRLVGFDAIEDDILKQLVVARLCQPSSKAGTVDYLKSHFDEDVALHQIYRYLDRLHNTQQEKIQQISVEHTRKILGGQIGLVFYDVTYSDFFVIPNNSHKILSYNIIANQISA